ncbi:MAG: hypothetical protein EOO94_01515, partial [Pedobacter sp.]
MKSKSIYIFLVLIILGSGCVKLDYENPNGPTDTQVLTSREGLLTLSIGMKQYYSTTGLQALLINPGVTSRELRGITTFTNVLELEAGGTALPTFNGNVLALWSSMLRTMGMADDLLNNADEVLATDNATRTGVIAFASLFKAMAISGLSTGFEQFPVQTDEDGAATFVTRQAALEAAIALLNNAVTSLAATPPSAEFNTRVAGTDLVLIDCINAYRARINMMLGKYAESLTAANAVNLTSKSQFVYNSQSPNPVYQQSTVAANYKPRSNFGLPSALVEAGDARLNFYLGTPDIPVGGETLKTLKGFFDDITKPIPVYLPDEVKLLKAEAILRSSGPLADAVTQINLVRTQSSGDPFNVYANLPAYSGAVTRDALLVEVYRQRSAELFLQGLRLED